MDGHGERGVAIERGWWDRPVPVALSGVAAVTQVNNNHQAADLLLNRWPAAPGPKHREARQAVLAAMRRHLDAKALARARAAFEAAAREADIIVE